MTLKDPPPSHSVPPFRARSPASLYSVIHNRSSCLEHPSPALEESSSSVNAQLGDLFCKPAFFYLKMNHSCLRPLKAIGPNLQQAPASQTADPDCGFLPWLEWPFLRTGIRLCLTCPLPIPAPKAPNRAGPCCTLHKCSMNGEGDGGPYHHIAACPPWSPPLPREGEKGVRPGTCFQRTPQCPPNRYNI